MVKLEKRQVSLVEMLPGQEGLIAIDGGQGMVNGYGLWDFSGKKGNK